MIFVLMKFKYFFRINDICISFFLAIFLSNPFLSIKLKYYLSFLAYKIDKIELISLAV